MKQLEAQAPGPKWLRVVLAHSSTRLLKVSATNRSPAESTLTDSGSFSVDWVARSFVESGHTYGAVPPPATLLASPTAKLGWPRTRSAGALPVLDAALK